MHGDMNPDVIVVPPRNTRAANQEKYSTVWYENAKYHNSPYYKAAKQWDTLPRSITDSGTITELKKHLKTFYSPFYDTLFVI